MQSGLVEVTSAAEKLLGVDGAIRAAQQQPLMASLYSGHKHFAACVQKVWFVALQKAMCVSRSHVTLH